MRASATITVGHFVQLLVQSWIHPEAFKTTAERKNNRIFHTANDSARTNTAQFEGPVVPASCSLSVRHFEGCDWIIAWSAVKSTIFSSALLTFLLLSAVLAYVPRMIVSSQGEIIHSFFFFPCNFCHFYDITHKKLVIVLFHSHLSIHGRQFWLWSMAPMQGVSHQETTTLVVPLAAGPLALTTARITKPSKAIPLSEKGPTCSAYPLCYSNIDFVYLSTWMMIAFQKDPNGCRSVEGQKLCWSGLISSDLQRCGLIDVWWDQAWNVRLGNVSSENALQEWMRKMSWGRSNQRMRKEATRKQRNGSWEGTSLWRDELPIRSIKSSWVGQPSGSSSLLATPWYMQQLWQAILSTGTTQPLIL